MKTLLHACCAPCSIMVIQGLRESGVEPVAYWFNPNIHPFTEYRERRDTLARYTASIEMEMMVNEAYGLREFVRAVHPNLEDRCGVCYRIRLEETARKAAELGFDSFTSTLFVSPYQRHELMRETAEKMAVKYGVEFLYRDFRPVFREGQQKARELELYMQKYCGCVFSEEERYARQLVPWAGEGSR